MAYVPYASMGVTSSVSSGATADMSDSERIERSISGRSISSEESAKLHGMINAITRSPEQERMHPLLVAFERATGMNLVVIGRSPLEPGTSPLCVVIKDRYDSAVSISASEGDGKIRHVSLRANNKESVLIV